MKKRQLRLHRINGVQRELAVADSALKLLGERLKANPNWGENAGWGSADFHLTLEKMENTYLIRIFAEFEAGLRDVWLNHLSRTSIPGAEQLITAMAGRFGVPADDCDNVHEVRILRNLLVHEGNITRAVQVTLAEAKSRLCRFFSRMPLDW